MLHLFFDMGEVNQGAKATNKFPSRLRFDETSKWRMFNRSLRLPKVFSMTSLLLFGGNIIVVNGEM